MKVRIKRIGKHNLPLPKYETDGASGFDLRAMFSYEETNEWDIYRSGATGGLPYVVLGHGDRVAMPCGFAFEVPAGYELQVRPRSGLSARGIVGTLGTVDSDYRGEVRVILTNTSGAPFTITTGDRIAQGIIAPVWQADLEEVEELTPTERGANGFGSTGTR